MNLYRGKQTVAHVGIGLGIVSLTASYFGAGYGAQLLSILVYATGRELEDVIEGNFENVEDSFRDLLEIGAGAVAGVLVQLVIGLF